MTIWEALGAFGRSYLFALAALLPILNPAATAPIFLGMTERASADTRHLLARRIEANAALLLAGSMLVGSHVLDFFGISLPIVRARRRAHRILLCLGVQIVWDGASELLLKAAQQVPR